MPVALGGEGDIQVSSETYPVIPLEQCLYAFRMV